MRPRPASSPAAIERDLAAILDLEHLEVRGLMTVGRLVERAEDARPTFAGAPRRSRSGSARATRASGRTFRWA